MGNVYNYQRISTKETDDKQSFNRQQSSLDAYAKENDLEYMLEFKDDVTGKDFNRPQWTKLEKIVKVDDTIIFKEVSRFTREATNGFNKYMELMNKGINLIFIDNPTISTDYIKNLMQISEQQGLIVGTVLKNTVELLIMVELDRVQQEREIIVKRIKQGIMASPNKSGRKKGTLDLMTKELRADIIEFLSDRSIKQVDLMKNHSISRNTLKKYIEIVKQEQVKQ